jgi:hypothetical protein
MAEKRMGWYRKEEDEEFECICWLHSKLLML